MRVKYIGKTDRGLVREHNEDALMVFPSREEHEFHGFDLNRKGTFPVFAVADGMGGANAGEVASSIFCDLVEKKARQWSPSNLDLEFLSGTLSGWIVEAHKRILDVASKSKDKEGMGTTVVLSSIVANHLVYAWCGDSRIYIFRKNAEGQRYIPDLLTNDHSLVWQLVEAGHLTIEEARMHPQSHIITRNLGGAEDIPGVESGIVKLRKDDLIILSSDGLHDLLSEGEMIKEVNDTRDLEEMVNQLVAQAKMNGGDDNITIVAVKVEEIDQQTPIDALAPVVTKEKKSKDIETKVIGLRDKGVSNGNSNKTKTWRLLTVILLIVACVLAMVLLFFQLFGTQNKGNVEPIDASEIIIEPKDSILEQQEDRSSFNQEVDPTRKNPDTQETKSASKVAQVESKDEPVISEEEEIISPEPQENIEKVSVNLDVIQEYIDSVKKYKSLREKIVVSHLDSFDQLIQEVDNSVEHMHDQEATDKDKDNLREKLMFLRKAMDRWMVDSSGVIRK